MENALGNNSINCNVPPAFKRAKLECIRLLANSLTRLSSFAHLAITARSVLQNREKVKKVHDDFLIFCRIYWFNKNIMGSFLNLISSFYSTFSSFKHASNSFRGSDFFSRIKNKR